IAVDANGVHVVGAFTNAQSFGGATLTSANGLYDAFVATFTSAGTHVWSERLGNAGGDDSADAVAAAGGALYVSGYVTRAVDFGVLGRPGRLRAEARADGRVRRRAEARRHGRRLRVRRRGRRWRRRRRRRVVRAHRGSRGRDDARRAGSRRLPREVHDRPRRD